MNSEHLIDALTGGTYSDPETGQRPHVGTRRVVIADDLGGAECDLLRDLDLGARLLLVSDPDTHRALGARVEAALKNDGGQSVVSHRLPARPHADAGLCAAVVAAARAAQADALVAVGSGTVNDIVKYAAFRCDLPYVVFATAPSMNGYVSGNASIMADGHKKSLAARPPAGVFLDLKVLTQAPRPMIMAGLGDSLCRPTAEADWLLAHLLLGRPYRKTPFDWLAQEEDALLGEAAALFAGDRAAMGRLVRTLILSGFGMTLCGGSYPASQGEHLIAHYLEMFMAPGALTALHGAQIAVTTLSMAHIQERMLEGPPPRLRPSRVDAADLAARFGPAIGAQCWREYAAKRLDSDKAEALNADLSMRWDAIRAAVQSVRRPAAALAHLLRAIDGPCAPGDIGVDVAFYRRAVAEARFLRDRYTFLDLAGDAGRLEALADARASS